MGWAFGLGLERIAMVLFSIPDIRLFWSQDARFLSQFSPGVLSSFASYSKYPPCYKDVSFWEPAEFHENDFCDIVRGVAEDAVADVQLVCCFRVLCANCRLIRLRRSTNSCTLRRNGRVSVTELTISRWTGRLTRRMSLLAEANDHL